MKIGEWNIQTNGNSNYQIYASEDYTRAVVEYQCKKIASINSDPIEGFLIKTAECMLSINQETKTIVIWSSSDKNVTLSLDI